MNTFFTKIKFLAQTKLLEMLMSENIYTNVWNINNISLQSDLEGPYLNHNKPHVGIFFDLNCKNSKDFLRKVKYFKNA